MAPLFASRYRLVTLIGVGGVGEVWSAFDTRLERDVALKLVRLDGMASDARDRFVREARVTARLRHPNAVTLFDAGDADGTMYLVMELVAGHTLADEIAAGPLDEERARAITVQLLDALDAAHSAGIVHRDVKPSNVLVDDGGHVKLADFGIARQLDAFTGDLTGPGRRLGTPKYYAPELLSGAAATAASDLYAVGVVLYEMLTGSPPFDRGTPVATAIAHANDPVPDAQILRPDLSPDLAAILDRALAKGAADRYASAADMRRAVEAASTGPRVPPTEVFTPGAYPGEQSNRRAWWVVAVTAALAAGTVAAVAVVRDDADAPPVAGASTSASTEPPPTEAATTPPAPPTTTPPGSATPVAAAAPADVDQLIVTLAADPERFGERARTVIDRLEKLGRGRKASERAAELLADAEAWVGSGELDPVVVTMLVPVLAPLADGPGNGRR